MLWSALRFLLVMGILTGAVLGLEAFIRAVRRKR
jgi:hypothetical protein